MNQEQLQKKVDILLEMITNLTLDWRRLSNASSISYGKYTAYADGTWSVSGEHGETYKPDKEDFRAAIDAAMEATNEQATWIS